MNRRSNTKANRMPDHLHEDLTQPAGRQELMDQLSTVRRILRDINDDPGYDNPIELMRLQSLRDSIEVKIKYDEACAEVNRLRAARSYTPNRIYRPTWFEYFQKIADRLGQKRAYEMMCKRFRLDLDTSEQDRFESFCRAYRRWNAGTNIKRT